jgi:hypothetical protein
MVLLAEQVFCGWKEHFHQFRDFPDDMNCTQRRLKPKRYRYLKQWPSYLWKYDSKLHLYTAHSESILTDLHFQCFLKLRPSFIVSVIN